MLIRMASSHSDGLFLIQMASSPSDGSQLRHWSQQRGQYVIGRLQKKSINLGRTKTFSEKVGLNSEPLPILYFLEIGKKDRYTPLMVESSYCFHLDWLARTGRVHSHKIAVTFCIVSYGECQIGRPKASPTSFLPFIFFSFISRKVITRLLVLRAYMDVCSFAYLFRKKTPLPQPSLLFSNLSYFYQ